MSFIFSPSPRSSFFEGRRAVVDIGKVEELKTKHPGIRIVATEGQTFSNEGVEITVEPNKALIVFGESEKISKER